jgi:hypothetical protein
MTTDTETAAPDSSAGATDAAGSTAMSPAGGAAPEKVAGAPATRVGETASMADEATSESVLARALRAFATDAASLDNRAAEPSPATAGTSAETPTAASADLTSLVRYLNELPQSDRAAWLESLPDVQASVSSAQQALAAELVGTVLGMDLARVPVGALEQAMQGRPEALREALIHGSSHIQQAVRIAHEAGTRASRSQLRGVYPLPPAGGSTPPAAGAGE